MIPYDFHPCLDCRKRVMGCHGMCQEYAAYRFKIDTLHAKIDPTKRQCESYNNYIRGKRYRT